MKIEVIVIGPDDKHKHLFMAKGKADGQECVVLVQQKGENAVLALNSSLPSTIGAEAVVSYKGNIVCRGKAVQNASLVFENVFPSLKPTKVDKEASILKNSEQLKEVATIVAEQSAVIQSQQKALNALMEEIQAFKNQGFKPTETPE
jgi:uncharacterized coiled-coil protein SlyX